MQDERINELVEQYHKALPERMRAYLNQRCLPDEIVDKFKIGWTGSAISIPIYNKDGEYTFFKFRRDPFLDSAKPKYWFTEGANAELYGWENITNPKPFLVICEGEFDRLVLESKGIPAVTSTAGVGTFKDEWIACLKEISNIYICFDRDHPSVIAASGLIEKIPQAKYVSLSKLPQGKKDITDFFVAGNTIQDFNRLLREAKSLDEFHFCFNALSSNEINFLHPSQDFLGNTAYFTIPFTEYTNEAKNPFKQLYYVVSSERKLLKLEDKAEFYNKYGKIIKDLPFIKNPEPRWQADAIKQFLFNGYTPTPYRVHAAIEHIYYKYSEIKDQSWYLILPLWVIGTYLYHLFETYPYLAFEGLKNTGKSKTARITTRMSFNGIFSVNASEATLYRDIENLRPTFGIDEAEILKDPEKSKSIRAILNAGHFKGACVLRQEKTSKGEFYTRKYSVYSPKLIANTKGLEDTLESRTIKIIMLRAKTEKGLLLDTETSEDWNHIRHLCYTFSLCFFKEIREIYLKDPEVKIANNRFNDLWCPLLSIARFVFLNHDQDKFNQIKDFALEQIGLSQDDSLDDRTSAFLKALKDLTLSTDTASSSEQIKKAMQPYLEDEDFLGITAKWIGWKMRSFGLNKDKHRINKGYLYHLSKKDVDDVLTRYLEPDYLPQEKTTLTTQTTPTTLV
ncbi:MAG: toprim domain-containing protein [Candidatus Omnitrophota bacterium]|nr:toprim domain-containing protein [Candidatus Omnitrophota bacterium]